MLIPTIIMGVLAIILILISYQKGVHFQGLRVSWNILLQIAPLLVFAFIVAGMLQTLIPQEIISRWVGMESGFRGIITGTVMGTITPGGPWISMPIAAGFLRAGAGVGTMVAFMAAWSLLAVHRLPLEVGIMGWKFALIRLACVSLFPLVAGLIANTFFSRVNLT
ncbi:permease [Chloroflexota bacterium]